MRFDTILLNWSTLTVRSMCFSICESETETNAVNFHRIFLFWFAEVPYDKITDCDVQETHSIF